MRPPAPPTASWPPSTTRSPTAPTSSTTASRARRRSSCRRTRWRSSTPPPPGVFVSTSAGNSGDTVGTSSVAHNAPWDDDGRRQHPRPGCHQDGHPGRRGDVHGPRLRPGRAEQRARRCPTTRPLAGADPAEANLCFSTEWAGHAVLDPAKVAGKIVICTRGTNDRVDKSKAVMEAGGVGHDPGRRQSPQRRRPPTSTRCRASTSNSVDGAAIKAYVTSARRGCHGGHLRGRHHRRWRPRRWLASPPSVRPWPVAVTC